MSLKPSVIKLLHTKNCNDSMMFISCLHPFLYPGEWSVDKDPDKIAKAIETSHKIAANPEFTNNLINSNSPLDIKCALLFKHEKITSGKSVIISGILSDSTILPPIGSSQVGNQNIVLTTMPLDNSYKLMRNYHLDKTGHIVSKSDDLELIKSLSNHLIYKEDFYKWPVIKKSFLEYIKVCVTPYSNLYSTTKVNTPGSEFIPRDKSLQAIKDFWEVWNANK